MSKIYNTGGSLHVLDRHGDRKAIEWFEAPTSDCDCGIFCCGDKKVLRWRKDNMTREVDLDAIFDAVAAGGKREY